MNDEQEFALYRQPWVLFEVQGGTFALPISAVEEMLPLGTALAAVEGRVSRRLMRYRDGVLALMDAQAMLDLPSDGAAGRMVVVVAWGGRRLGLVVERTLGVEPLPRRSAGIMEVAPGLKGANTPVNAIAAHADYPQMILCLDPEWLFRGRLAKAS